MFNCITLNEEQRLNRHDCYGCRFEERIEPFKDKVPEDVRRVIEDEMAKLSGLEQASSEFNVTRNYLDWLTSLPWGQFSEELLDIEHARKVRPWHCGCHA